MNKITIFILVLQDNIHLEKNIGSLLQQKVNFSMNIYILSKISNVDIDNIIRKYKKSHITSISHLKLNKECNFNSILFEKIMEMKTPFYSILEDRNWSFYEKKFQAQVDLLSKHKDCSFCDHNVSFNQQRKKVNEGNKLFSMKLKMKTLSKIKALHNKKIEETIISSRVYRASIIKESIIKDKRVIGDNISSYLFFLLKGKLINIENNMLSCSQSLKRSNDGTVDRTVVEQIYAAYKELNFQDNKLFFSLLKPFLLKERIINCFNAAIYMNFLSDRKIKKKLVELVSRLDLRYVKLFLPEGKNNLGDMLSYLILQKVFGLEYVKSTVNTCDLAMVGSILDLCFFQKIEKPQFQEDSVCIWGAGFISHSATRIKRVERFIRPVEIFALRGKYSKKRCEKIISRKLTNIALGDPGLLANRLINYNKEIKRYDVGIIPHFSDQGRKCIGNIQLDKYTSTVIDVLGDTLEILKKIAQCKFILSSAMHGLIVADSFGIPNKWIKLSDNVITDFKFKDYYSVFSINEPKAIDMRKEKILDEDIELFIKEYAITKSKVEEICSQLLASFPKSFAQCHLHL